MGMKPRSKPVQLLTISLIRSQFGHECLTLGKKGADWSTRIVGEKPWGGGQLVKSWDISKADLLKAIEEGSP